MKAYQLLHEVLFQREPSLTGYVFTLCWTHNSNISFAEEGLLAIILVGLVALGIMGDPGADKACPPGWPMPCAVLDLIIGAGDEYDGDAVKDVPAINQFWW